MSMVIVGYDAREQSNDALILGKSLARALGAELHVAVVVPRWGTPFETAIAGRRVSDQLDDELYRSAERLLGHADFTRASLDGDLGGRSAARALHEYAEQQKADLIVVGSSHRGKLGRILPGSVGESLLRGAPCAVAVAPRGFARRERHGFGLIGIAYDRSPEADQALREAARLADAVDAELRVITVMPPVATYFPNGDVMNRLLEDHDRFYRSASEEAISKLGDEQAAETTLLTGDPAVLLAEQGIELDLLVVGSRGYGPVRSALVGATSCEVMRTAPCPVLVVPRGVPSQDQSEAPAHHELATGQ